MKKTLLAFLFVIGIGFISLHVQKKNKSNTRYFLRHETWIEYFNPEKFQSKLQHPPAWMKEQIAEDFQHFETAGISEAQVNATFATIRKNYSHSYIIRYRIIDNKLYRFFPDQEPVSLKNNTTEKALKTLLHFFPFKDADFILSYIDGVPLRGMPPQFYYTPTPELQAPVLFSAKTKNTSHIVLIPDWRSVGDWWAKDARDILKTSQEKSWESKKPFAVWRGSLTNGMRLTLCNLAQANPQFLDAKLNVKVEDTAFQEELERKGMSGSRLSWEEYLDNKYLPIIDGVMCAAPALQWRLLSNSLTLKQESDDIQWFYRAIQPYIHYVPIKNDLSDLISQLQWAKDNDAKCQKIVENSQKFALENLLFEDVQLYFYLVLQKYGSLQTLNRQQILEEMKSDPHWVNIHNRHALKEQNIANSVPRPTPF